LEPVAVTLPPAVPKVEGQSLRTYWRAEVRDFHALVKHVAQRVDHLNLLLPNERNLNDLAKALRDQLNVPGVVAVPKLSKVVRRG
jgi:sirohydrochlorin ferrochelatase